MKGLMTNEDIDGNNRDLRHERVNELCAISGCVRNIQNIHIVMNNPQTIFWAVASTSNKTQGI